MSITVNEYIFWLVHISEFLCILLKSKGTSPKPGVHSLIPTILAKSWWSYTHFNPDTGGKSETLERNVLKSIFRIWKFGRLVRKEQSQNLDVSLASGTNPSSNHSGALDTQVLLPNLLLALEHILNLGWINKSWHQENSFLTSLVCSEIVFIFSHSCYLPCRQDLQLSVTWKLLWLAIALAVFFLASRECWCMEVTLPLPITCRNASSLGKHRKHSLHNLEFICFWNSVVQTKCQTGFQVQSTLTLVYPALLGFLAVLK